MEAVGFKEGKDFKPAIYYPSDDYTNPVTFVFMTVDEQQVTEWARLVLQLRDSGVDDVSIVWLLQDESEMTDDEIDYVFAHAEKLMEMSEGLGWVLAG